MRFVLLLALLIAACATAGGPPPVGGDLRRRAVATGTLLLSGPSETREAYNFVAEGVPFRLGVTDGRVRYVATTSPAFLTPEGLRVGDMFSAVRSASGSAPVLQPGWAYVVELPSGWRAAFVQGETMTAGPLHDTTRVRWFFRGS